MLTTLLRTQKRVIKGRRWMENEIKVVSMIMLLGSSGICINMYYIGSVLLLANTGTLTKRILLIIVERVLQHFDTILISYFVFSHGLHIFFSPNRSFSCKPNCLFFSSSSTISRDASYAFSSVERSDGHTCTT